MFLILLKLINWVLTKQKRTPIVDKQTMEDVIMKQTIEPVIQVRDWSIDRIHLLSESSSSEDHLNAIAIAEEYDEWINLPEGINELNCLVIENNFL